MQTGKTRYGTQAHTRKTLFMLKRTLADAHAVSETRSRISCVCGVSIRFTERRGKKTVRFDGGTNVGGPQEDWSWEADRQGSQDSATKDSGIDTSSTFTSSEDSNRGDLPKVRARYSPPVDSRRLASTDRYSGNCLSIEQRTHRLEFHRSLRFESSRAQTWPGSRFRLEYT